MLNLNRAMILGNATRDPETRYTPNGRAVANFGVATNRRWTTQAGDTQEKVEFHDIVAWGKLAEITGQIIKKGAKVYVEGRLETRSWEAPDGSKRQKTEIIAENIIALSPRGYSEGSASPAPQEPSVGVDKVPEENINQLPEDEKPAKPALKPTPKSTKKEDKEDKKDEDAIDLNDIPF